MSNEQLMLIRKNKYVGIIIHDKASLFSNGITQNAYFIYSCLEHIGLKCKFLCFESNPSKFEYRDLPLTQISTNPLEFDASEFHTIITVTRGLILSEYEMFKKQKIHVVSFVCGNQIMHHLEDFVRGPYGSSTYVGKNAYCDEAWLIPSLADSLEYVSLIRGKPTFVIPHLWSPQFLSENFTMRYKKPDSELFYKQFHHNDAKIDIIILEPNLYVLKTAWIPLLAAEKLHITDNERIENAYVFNFPKHDSSYKMTDNLCIQKKIRYFKRLSMPEIISYFNEKKTFPVIVCHQIYNSLNYLYYEALHYGWPLVHNSPDLEGCGYFYPENNISACSAAIMDAYKNHNKNYELYIEKAHKYLKRVDPFDETVGKIWNGYINSGISKNIIT
jgi:hypothetical protein